MLCPYCGKPVPVSATCCAYCGCFVNEEETDRTVPDAWPAREMKIPNHLWFSILMLVICLPMGAAALVYSVRVERYVLQQDYPAAREASFRARKINILGLMILGVAAAAYFSFMIVVMLVVN